MDNCPKGIKLNNQIENAFLGFQEGFLFFLAKSTDFSSGMKREKQLRRSRSPKGYSGQEVHGSSFVHRMESRVPDVKVGTSKSQKSKGKPSSSSFQEFLNSLLVFNQLIFKITSDVWVNLRIEKLCHSEGVIATEESISDSSLALRMTASSILKKEINLQLKGLRGA